MSVHGKDLHFEVDDAAGTLRDLSPNLNSVDFNQANDTHDDTTYGQTGHTKKGGLTDGTIVLKGFWDTTALVGTETVLPGLLGKFLPGDFIYGPEGSASGKVKKTGTAVLKDYQTSAPVADLIAFTANFEISGAVTKGTFSA